METLDKKKNVCISIVLCVTVITYVLFRNISSHCCLGGVREVNVHVCFTCTCIVYTAMEIGKLVVFVFI